jgi:hypothetical protein
MIEPSLTKSQVLDIVSNRVEDVETQIGRLDELIDAEAKHQSEITRLAEEKTRILVDRSLDKQQRINKVGKLLAAVEVEDADLSKTKTEILAQREDTRELGTTARAFITHVFDQLCTSRLNRAEIFVEEFFYQTPIHLPAKDIAKLSNLFREVELLEYDLHPKHHVEDELIALRRLKEQWLVIRELCEREPGLELGLPAHWLG